MDKKGVMSNAEIAKGCLAKIIASLGGKGKVELEVNTKNKKADKDVEED